MVFREITDEEQRYRYLGNIWAASIVMGIAGMVLFLFGVFGTLTAGLSALVFLGNLAWALSYNVPAGKAA